MKDEVLVIAGDGRIERRRRSVDSGETAGRHQPKLAQEGLKLGHAVDSHKLVIKNAICRPDDCSWVNLVGETHPGSEVVQIGRKNRVLQSRISLEQDSGRRIRIDHRLLAWRKSDAFLMRLDVIELRIPTQTQVEG